MYHTCPELSKISLINHGFFTRNGGVSDGIYASLNCGYGSGDDFAKVSENRRRVAAGMGGETLCTVHQTHSPDAVIVTDIWEHKDAPKADALVTNKLNIILGVLTADCLPILFADGKNRVIAAAHSGWKGAMGGIIENTIEKMQQLGANMADISATIGPAIAQKSYEVGAEFFERFVAISSENSRFFMMQNDKYLFDLSAYATHRLTKSGISQINIIAQDTYFNDNEFFSYRRSCKRGEPAYGRQISVIKMIG
ncbi:MAG: peptidoglycan editing factor PgeF, partial [Rickettsiales bacterium]